MYNQLPMPASTGNAVRALHARPLVFENQPGSALPRQLLALALAPCSAPRLLAYAAGRSGLWVRQRLQRAPRGWAIYTTEKDLKCTNI